MRLNANGGARLVGRDGVEMAGVDARRNDRDFVRVGPVEELQLRQFRRRRGDDAIGRTENVLLAVDAVTAFKFLGRTGHPVFHQNQGVKHVQQGQIPASLQLQAGNARHPVMAVD